MGAVRWGTHLCQLYRTARDLDEILVAFIASGLANGEQCVWIVSAPQTLSEARAALGAVVPDLAQRIAAGQLELVAGAARTERNDAPPLEHVIEGWLAREEAALRAGHAGLRITGGAPWGHRELDGRDGEPEARVHAAFRERRILALCSYHVDRYTPEQIVDLLRCHDGALIRHHGAWTYSTSATAALALVTERTPDVATSPLHTVEFFEHEDFPAHAMARRLAEALARGHAAIALTSRARLAPLRAALEKRGEVDVALATRQLVLLDADTVRAELAGAPHLGAALDALVGTVVRAAAATYGRVRVYGDLVDVLSREGARGLALEAEGWWNQLLAELPVELHCGYSVEAFDDAASLPDFRAVCDAHAHVLARATVGSAKPDRLAAELQQVSTILEHETARREAVETAYQGSRTAEQGVREHLVVLQHITSALGDAVTFADVGAVVSHDLGVALAATGTALVNGGELLALRGGTAPADPSASARAIDALPAQWTPRARVPAALSWLGGALVAVIPLVFAGRRIGTLVLGFERATVEVTERALAEDLARQVAAALERARAFELVVKERVRAERANAAKDQFLAMLGHELRNPLSPILTATQLMRLRAPEQLAKERDTVERNVGRMIRIVDDLLDVSRIARGKVELSRGPHEVATIIAQAVEATTTLFEEHGHQVIVDVPHGLVVDVDPGRMSQVVMNLLANAAKYTKPGGTIAIAATARGPEAVISVADDGVGIAPDLLPAIFDLFVQSPQGVDRARGGLGIGLAIARTLVELHGGTIAAASDGPGRGARFTVTVPRWHASAEPPEPELEPAGDNARRILVVDDNEDAAWLLAEALRLLGHDVRVTHDGISALELVRDWPPELAFLDIGLPGMDGYALCKQLAKLPARPHIIAVTGYGQPADRERAHQVGFDAHFVKPVSLRDVQNAIEAFERGDAS